MSNIDQLVLRRMMQWEEQAKLAEQAGMKGQKPAIALSRSCGSGGHSSGLMAAGELGLHVYDKEIVEQIAQRAKVRQQVVESLDDRLVNRIANWVGEQFDNGYFTYSDYLEHLSRVLLTIAEQERAVIIGRGANFILKPERTLRVRADAPLEIRIKRIAEAQSVAEQEARARVLEQDAARAAFVRRHFDRDVTASEHYDLVLNTAVLSEEAAAKVIVEAYRRRFA